METKNQESAFDPFGALFPAEIEGENPTFPETPFPKRFERPGNKSHPWRASLYLHTVTQAKNGKNKNSKPNNGKPLEPLVPVSCDNAEEFQQVVRVLRRHARIFAKTVGDTAGPEGWRKSDSVIGAVLQSLVSESPERAGFQAFVNKLAENAEIPLDDPDLEIPEDPKEIQSLTEDPVEEAIQGVYVLLKIKLPDQEKATVEITDLIPGPDKDEASQSVFLGMMAMGLISLSQGVLNDATELVKENEGLDEAPVKITKRQPPPKPKNILDAALQHAIPDDLKNVEQVLIGTPKSQKSQKSPEESP